jgi:DNA-directed RNA polymerase
MENLESYSAPENTGETSGTPTSSTGAFSFDFNSIPTLGQADRSVTAGDTYATRTLTFEEQYGDRPRHLVAVQLKLEEDAVERAVVNLNSIVEERGLEATMVGQAALRSNINAVITRIQAWLDSDAAETGGRNFGAIKYARQFDADELAVHAIRQVLDAVSMDAAPRFAAVVDRVMRELEDTDLEARLAKHDPWAHKRYVLMSKKPGRYNKTSAILKKHGEYVGAFDSSTAFAYGPSQRAMIGNELIRIVCEETGWAEITKNVLANGDSFRTVDVLRATDEAVDAFNAALANSCELLMPKFQPMVVIPRPWVKGKAGGFLSKDLKGIVSQSRKQRKGAKSVASEAVCAAINAVQETAWRINKDVLACVNKVDLVAEMVRRPAPPAHLLALFEAGVKMDEDQLAQWVAFKTEDARVCTNNSVAISKARSHNMAQECAARMAEFDAIYFPHTLDFRGRAYPISAHLNPQKDDLSKGLLEFSEALPLGSSGKFWLAVHGANTFGEKDKAPFVEREQWVLDHQRLILDDAANPNRTGALWKDADAPYMFLAFCFEWAALCNWIEAGKQSSLFLSRLPVGMDGSCNGIQHYSAMLRDQRGGEATNLVKQDRPADIYALVAAEVKKACELDLMDEEKAPYATLWIQKGITRKTAKRNTMTLPYGVTKIGMKDQLLAEIVGGPQMVSTFTGVEKGGLKYVSYLAEKNWDACAVVVSKARQAMDFLKDSAGVCNKAGKSITWTTPDGYQVEQAYGKTEAIAVQTRGHSFKIKLNGTGTDLNTRKQSTSIAPNFVHSIDACHMRMTVVALKEAGVNAFAMVHDSFGTHAGNIETLQQVTREQFVKLHTDNLLENFLAEIAEVIGAEAAEKLPTVPARGELDLNAVLQSDYFFA